MINGLINVYKEPGYTSFDVVAIMRGISGQHKIGHTGTLDPMAEGVLPICLGNATKLCDMLKDKVKEYVATFMLGQRTDTLDSTGTILETKTPRVSENDLRAAIASFEGGYEQLPPMYSAKWVDGKRLYDLAREGKEIERPSAFVEIYEIEVLDMSLPYVTIRVKCGKGTYIRSLCEDIAQKCSEIAVMTALKRTQVSNFFSKDAKTVSELTRIKNEGKLSEHVIPTDYAFMEYTKMISKKSGRKYLDNGNKLYGNQVIVEKEVVPDEILRTYNDDDEFVGLYRYDAESETFVPYKMFLRQ